MIVAVTRIVCCSTIDKLFGQRGKSCCNGQNPIGSTSGAYARAPKQYECPPHTKPRTGSAAGVFKSARRKSADVAPSTRKGCGGKAVQLAFRLTSRCDPEKHRGDSHS